jgi:hypothetical protein
MRGGHIVVKVKGGKAQCKEQNVDDEPRLPAARPFNPWRRPKTERAKAVIRDVLNQVQNYEKYLRKRQRGRKPADQQVFEATITALICDLIHHHLSGQGEGVFITRSNQILGRKSRYRPLAYGKSLPDILDRMASPEMEFVSQQLGSRNPFFGDRRTIVKAGKRLITRLEDHDVTWDDLGESEDQEVIILKDTKEDYWDDGEWMEYKDTPETQRYRDEMGRINAWLSEADISFDEAVAENSKVVDPNERRLRRVFTRERFDCGGRLFGGFWQSLTKKERREGVEIQNEKAVELDYGQMNPRILYGLCGAEPPSGDLYLLPGLEEHRNGIKKVMNAMLFATKRLTRMPKGVRAEFSKSHPVWQVMETIEEHNQPIKERFFSGIGHSVQFHESQIMVDLLLTLRDRGIVALPIHDGVMVPITKKGEVKDIMLSTFFRHTNVQGLVREESIDKV